jgi:2-phosphosulfolactate phosphatase
VDRLFAQDSYALRFDWGMSGAERSSAEVVVVVDVLSFSTAVSIAVDRGMVVFPYRWADESAAAFARDHDAALAVGRLEALRSGSVSPSLSSSALLTCTPAARLVLPSPNGSSIAEELRSRGTDVAVGCLRNASATARYVQRTLEAGQSATFVAAGEKWDGNDALRPCLEDHLGAGAALAVLAAAGLGDRMSPEARAAAMLFSAHGPALGQAIRDSVSGRELDTRGFGSDVAAAVELDASPNVPILNEGAFSLLD